MKFASIYLSNYIGIYNGMGLYDIHIDMTKCQNRITIIRGDNGSGKSTLSKAMSLFPDPNDAFIPGLAARKEIVLIDGDTFYKLIFVHGVKSNGDREVTKAYITKTFGGNVIELNENGNVSSYKDILYSELGLDSNFAALSQLSNDDRGLADKKPAERKRFVNSIITSLETYNNIYKTLSKRATSFKSMINSLVGKLNVLGDESVVIANLDAIEGKINILRDQKDKAFADLAREQSMITLLDPDGSIQSTNTVVSAELDLAEKEYRKIQSIIDSLITSNGIKTTDFQEALRRITADKNEAVITNQINRNRIDTLISQKEAQAQELNQKLHRLTQLTSGESYEDIVHNLEVCISQMESIKVELLKVGLTDISNLNKEEYILALETLKDLEAYISAFKSGVQFSIIDKIVSQYIQTGVVPSPIDISEANHRYTELESDKSNAIAERSILQSRMSLLDKLSLRPSDCIIGECPFIKEALEFSNTKPNSRIDQLDALVYSVEAKILETETMIKSAMEYNDAVNRFAIIVREVDKNGAILSKMPNGDMFKNKVLFFERLMSGYGFEYMASIYQYIDLANLFDTYKHLDGIRQKYEAELKVYESKADVLKDLQQEIDAIDRSISKIVDQIEPIRAEIEDREKDIAIMIELQGVYTAILDYIEQQKPIRDKIDECRKVLTENSRKINEINLSLARAASHKESIQQISFSLDPLLKERDKLHHSAQLIQDYRKELDELQANYDFIEKIKYFSSPTTGIQLVFMELYMGKIIALANELLKLLFNGQFEIQPFVINESEFRIPCRGGGYLNDDISSMSSSQIGMISMILSFALLHHSSTKYNIIKLDEIDGPLDYTNRLYFMDVLNSIMDIMHTEQCIMISHNSELQVDNSDVILLRHDETNNDYLRGNIIWKF